MPIRCVLQRCGSAKLLIDNVDKWCEIGSGVIIYIGFLKDTNHEEVDTLVHKIFSNVIFRTLPENEEDGRNETHIMIIPQFSLGGKLKSGKSGTQYHQCESPNIASKYYDSFCKLLKDKAKETQNDNKNIENLKTFVKCGVFGNRQGLQVTSDGPFSHCFDIEMKQNANKSGSKESKSTKKKSDKNGKHDKKMNGLKKSKNNNDQNDHSSLTVPSNRDDGENIVDKLDQLISFFDKALQRGKE